MAITRDLITILRLVSKNMKDCHPMVQNIRYDFHSTINDEPWDVERWHNYVDWGYTLREFIGMLIKDKHFRQRIILYLEEQERLFRQSIIDRLEVKND